MLLSLSVLLFVVFLQFATQSKLVVLGRHLEVEHELATRSRTTQSQYTLIRWSMKMLLVGVVLVKEVHHGTQNVAILGAQHDPHDVNAYK